MPPDGSCTALARSTDRLTSPFATVTTLTGSPSCVKNRSAASPDGASVSKPAKPDRSAKIVDMPSSLPRRPPPLPTRVATPSLTLKKRYESSSKKGLSSAALKRRARVPSPSLVLPDSQSRPATSAVTGAGRDGGTRPAHSSCGGGGGGAAARLAHTVAPRRAVPAAFPTQSP